MDPSQKITVLLAEYNTLRAEVLAARGNVAQAASLTVPVVMALIGFSFSTSLSIRKWVVWAVAVVAAAYLGVIFVWNEVYTRRFTAQLRMLEHKINELAGEQLLTWETQHGWGGFSLPANPKLTTPKLPHSN